MDLRAVVLSGGCLTTLRSIFKSYDNPPPPHKINKVPILLYCSRFGLGLLLCHCSLTAAFPSASFCFLIYKVFYVPMLAFALIMYIFPLGKSFIVRLP